MTTTIETDGNMITIRERLSRRARTKVEMNTLENANADWCVCVRATSSYIRLSKATPTNIN